MRGCINELRGEILAHRAESIVRLPKFIRSNLSDSSGDGVDYNRFAALMTRKEMFITFEKLKKQHDFLREQFTVCSRGITSGITVFLDRPFGRSGKAFVFRSSGRCKV